MERKAVNTESPIGFFDSGVGGISVLKEALKVMPNENFIYFGDSINAPYGTKTTEEVRELSFDIVEMLLDKGVKGVVVACNTATSAAVAKLRVKYPELPIVGIEPALKPAVESDRAGKIIIMATPMTLAEGKFSKLVERLGMDRKADITPLPCAGLMEFVERGETEGENLENYLREKLAPYVNEDINAIVLGCTHYPFIKNSIKKVMGRDIKIIDGSLGTSKEMKRKLKEKNLLNESKEKGKIEIYNSLNNEMVQLSKKLLDI
ncbi:MAG: glutamate racemase [Sarcina sp.]